MTTTLAALQAGSLSVKWTALIEGCKYALSDAPESAVQTALAGTDWSSATVVNGLFVTMRNRQTIDPGSPFAGAGRCTLRVIDTDGADTFGTFINKRLSGAETEITSTVDRDDTTISVKSTTGFTSSGEIYIGTECIGYSSKTSTTFTGLTRGKYSPIGCDPSGTGGSRFASHHRHGVDARYVQRHPLVTQLPRVWIGKRVSLYLHTWSSGALNTRSDAQLVFAGRIVGIADDPDTFHTVIEVEHYAKEIENGVIGKDMWSAEMPMGLRLVTGRKFKFTDFKDSVGSMDADDLEVVASGASGTNQINAGWYQLGAFCERLNDWLAGETNAGRIYGSYSWASPVSYRADGLRTVCNWRISHASSIQCSFQLVGPSEVMAFLGLRALEPASGGAMAAFGSGPGKYTNRDHATPGEAVPFTQLIFRPYGPGRVAQEFGDPIIYEAENERGTFSDQRDLMPASLQTFCPAGSDWGIFLLDEKSLMVGSYDGAGTLSNCFIAPYRTAVDSAETDAISYIGRKADEPLAPITLRQIFILEGSFESLLNKMVYSSGAAGYNHDTYDTLSNGLGLGLPGGLLGAEWENSVANLPSAQAPLVVVIDEPTRFADLFDGDLRIRRAFVRWKDQGFEVCEWRTPVLASSVASLTEDNKAAPSGTEENHRAALEETDEFVKTSVKIDYARDFAIGRDGKYLKSISIEDQASADDGGNGSTGARSLTLKMRNTFDQFANTGQSVEALLPGFMVTMPVFSSAGRRLRRTIDHRYFEGYSVGDVVDETDEFARDPLTGRRGITSRPAVIVDHSYDLGGPTASGGKREMTGEVDLMFLDVHRGDAYSPCADVDDTASAGGFSAGYNSGTSTLRCYSARYSQSVSYTNKRGLTISLNDAADASHFEVGDNIVIVERDPSNPASPTSWSRTVQSVSGDDITLTSGLSSPAWDATKKYRIISADYTTATATQQDDSYQADDTDLSIQDLDPATHYASDPNSDGGPRVANSGTDKCELVPDLSYGDGKPLDVGHDRAIANGLNQYIDYKSAHQFPVMMAGTDRSIPGLTGFTIDDAVGSLFIYPVFCGTEHLNSTVTRTLTVAPFFKSILGATAYVRVTLTDRLPTLRNAEEEGAVSGGDYGDPVWPSGFSQTETWTTNSTTYQTGADKTLSLQPKEIFFGVAWLVVEGSGDVDCRGLAKCIEGARVV